MNLFTIKLNNNIEFQASRVKEQISYEVGTDPIHTLEIKIEDNSYSTDYYDNLLNGENALSTITVTDASNTETIFNEYKYVKNISRTLVDGNSIIFILLSKTDLKK